ncbi:MAG: IS21 family transposase [Lachnospiraceae bacterium]|nr:IS21 family transposase [Lachnospiraceae bacterium]
MYELEDWAAVQRVYKQTKSKRETARVLGISRNTVKSLLEKTEAPTYNRTVYKSKIDDFKEQIIEWRCKPYEFNGTRIFRELKKRGYTGSIGPVYYYLKKINEDIGDRISSKATCRHESPPGDQAQFDWSEYQIPVGGVERTVYCFSMILAASRKKAVCFSLKSDAPAIYEAIQELFEELGGVTLELLIDNPKALVIENNPKTEDEIRYNPHALLLARHLGTELNACPCYWPRKKGKIEKPFTYIEEQFVKGNSFSSMEELNKCGKKFVKEWCDEKHTTTKRVPNLHYEQEERAALLPLPEKRYRMKELESRIISADCYISIGGNKYSVPSKYATKTMKFRIVYGFRIEIYDKKENPVLTWEVSMKKHDTQKKDEHYADITPKISTSIPQIRRDFTEWYTNGLKYLEAADKKFDQPTHHARKIMLLEDLYDRDILDCFIGYAVEHGQMDITSFKGLLKDYNAGKLSLPGLTTVTEKEESLANDKGQYRDDDPALLRDCAYYEENVGGVSA